MMLLPAIKQMQFDNGEAVSIFQDDAQFWRFYAIPGFPSVRTDKNGNPVFMLIAYLFDDQTREENPDLGLGGGYMVFDAELKISEENRVKMVDELQKLVADEFKRLKNMPNGKVRSLALGATFNDSIGGHWGGQGHEGTPRANPTTSTNTTLNMPSHDHVVVPVDEPLVVIGEPLWVDGKVTMNAPSSAGLVQNMIGERRASLLGNNVAAFSIDLTPPGAMFMKKTLVGEDGSGGSDLAPIQVAYELTAKVKLPPASMYIRFDTASLYHSVQELFHEHNNCSDDYFTSENMMSTAIESGLITVKIDMGGVTDDELEQLLVQQAMNTVQTLLTEKFANKEREPMEEWADDDLAESSKEVYRLKRVTEVDMTNFEQTLEINPTTEVTFAPQGTLSTFFRGRTDMDAFVREIRLEDDFFKSLQLDARAFANWQEDGIAFVELHVEYKHGGETKTNTFTFTPDDVEPQSWNPALIDGNRKYRYRYRVAFLGQEPGDWSKWEKTTTRDLNVSVESPGMLDVTATGVGLDFDNVLDAVLVHMRYKDARNDVPMAAQSILLSAERTSGEWKRNLFAPWEKPIEYRTEYLLKNGREIETGWKKTDGPTQNLLVTRPDVDVLDISLIPAGIWTDVIQSAVSVRYQDGDHHADQQFNIKKPEEFKKWSVLLMDRTKREFEYRILATFTNGDTQETEWLTREGDQAVPIKIKGPPRLEVKLSGQVLDYASTPVAQVDMHYRGADGADVTDSFSLQSPTDVHTWSIPISDDTVRNYEYQVTYFPVEGDPVEREMEVTEDELIVVPRYSIPKVGASFSPVLQNFSQVAAVEVNLTYDDAQRDVHEAHTLIFTTNEKQSWFLPVADDADRHYKMTTTWYFIDGTDYTSSEMSLRKPAVLLPRPKIPAEA